MDAEKRATLWTLVGGGVWFASGGNVNASQQVSDIGNLADTVFHAILDQGGNREELYTPQNLWEARLQGLGLKHLPSTVGIDVTLDSGTTLFDLDQNFSETGIQRYQEIEADMRTAEVQHALEAKSDSSLGEFDRTPYLNRIHDLFWRYMQETQTDFSYDLVLREGEREIIQNSSVFSTDGYTASIFVEYDRNHFEKTMHVIVEFHSGERAGETVKTVYYSHQDSLDDDNVLLVHHYDQAEKENWTGRFDPVTTDFFERRLGISYASGSREYIDGEEPRVWDHADLDFCGTTYLPQLIPLSTETEAPEIMRSVLTDVAGTLRLHGIDQPEYHPSCNLKLYSDQA